MTARARLHPRLLAPAVRLLFLGVVLLAIATPALAQRKACLDCHADFKSRLKEKFVHSPVKESCEKCHMRHGFTQKLVLTKKLPDLCIDCHAGVQKDLESANVHGALAKGGCTGCHDPHAADNRQFLRKSEGGKSVCLGCHEELASDAALATAHDPFKKGDCAVCHAPHASERPNLLVSDETTMCGSCHKNALAKHDKIPAVADVACTDCHDPHLSSKKTKLAATAHQPFAEGDCESCHSVEGGEVDLADDFPPADLCAACHDDVTAAIAGGESHFGADPMAGGGTATCLKCHDAHRSREKGLLVKGQKDLCRSCHESLPQPAGFKGSMHPPFAEGTCSTCHEPHGGGGDAHLARAGNDLCSTCHADIVAPAGKGEVRHEALDAMECRDCHSGHASAEAALLKKPEGDTCTECHEKTRFSHEHPPYLTSDCGACHSNHSRTPKLLAGEVNQVCGQCHEAQLGAIGATFPHPPAKDDNCLSCHAPHGSENKGLLTESQKGLCTGCHDIGDLVVQAAASEQPPQVHAPVDEGRCGDCHDPHGSTRKWLVRDERDGLCYGCHTKQKVSFMEGTQHAPVAEGNCDVCHTPHGSTAGALRTKNEPDLCTQCHDFGKPPLAGSHRGFDVTRSTCTSCHTPHSSKEEHLLNPVVHPPFADGDCESCHEGGKTATGAMAAVAKDACLACHDEKSAGKGHQHAEGVSCVSCHQPHSSRDEHLLINPQRLCRSCHEDVVQAGAEAGTVHRHRPVEEGRCLDCHQMHEPAAEKLLVKKPLELCSSCHESVAARTGDRTKHEPFARGDCAACHEVHAAARPNLLKKDEGGLCKSCHGLTTEKMTAAHKQVPLTGAACTTCHDPHGTRAARSKLVLPNLHPPYKDKDCGVCHDEAGKAAGTVEVCAACHENTKGFQQAHSAGRTGAAAAEMGVCLDCHSPHAGHDRLLVRSSETQTCLQCHDRREFKRKTVHAALEEGCTTCHDLHDREKLALRGAAVNDKCSDCHDAATTHAHPTSPDKRDPRTRGPLTCVGCHEPHSSDFERMLTHDQKRDLCVQCHATGMER